MLRKIVGVLFYEGRKCLNCEFDCLVSLVNVTTVTLASLLRPGIGYGLGFGKYGYIFECPKLYAKCYGIDYSLMTFSLTVMHSSINYTTFSTTRSLSIQRSRYTFPIKTVQLHSLYDQGFPSKQEAHCSYRVTTRIDWLQFVWIGISCQTKENDSD